MKDIKHISYKFNFINPTKESNPFGAFAPSCRGTDQLVIYTNDNLYKTKNNYSGVNPYGFEAAINSKGVVIDLNDRVKLPKNGFIVSGHGVAHRFIQKNFLLGSKVSINHETSEIIVDTDKHNCLLIEYKTKKQNIIKKYKKVLKEGHIIDIKKIDSLLIKIDEIYKAIKKNDSNFNKLFNKANKIFDQLYLLTSPSYKIASRNAWHRPSEKTLQEIIETLDICKKLNLNGLYLESFYNGDIPGISTITNTNEEVRNCYYGETYKNDYLLAFISEAHKRNIEVHAWVECYFVGEQKRHWKTSYKDSWKMVNYDGSTVQGNNPEGNEKDFVFLDPANPECMEYVLSIYKELLTKYDFDGINVDYIRYPHGNLNLSSSNGYTEYAMNEFKKLNNLTGDVRELVKDRLILQKWIDYRCDKITLLMKNVRKLVNEVKPNCYLSTAVCSELDYAIKNKMQNWKVWARKGWLDLTFPMAYYEGCSEVANATHELCMFNKNNAYSYTGIMCMMKNLPGDLVIKQINTLFDNGADGYNLFCLWDVLKRKDVRYNLLHSVNKLESIHPHCDVKLLLKYFIKEINGRKPYLKDDEQVLLITSFVKKLIKKDFPLSKLIDRLSYVRLALSNKNILKELNKLIRYIKVKKNIIDRRKAA